jgi:hypothetical protein
MIGIEQKFSFFRRGPAFLKQLSTIGFNTEPASVHRIKQKQACLDRLSQSTIISCRISQINQQLTTVIQNVSFL